MVCPICTMLMIRHFCCYSDFSPPNVKHLIWSDDQGAFRYPDFEPDQNLSDHGPDIIFGTERYRLHNQIWSRLWSDKDLVQPNWFCKRGHRTRPNSGPDQINLILKISTQPIRSWCCLHIHTKFWSVAAVDNSEPRSVPQRMSQQCLQTVC